jgi:hypothetical protein
MDDLAQLEPPCYCTPQLASSGGSPVPSTPLSLFYPPNLGKHFKVCCVGADDVTSNDAMVMSSSFRSVSRRSVIAPGTHHQASEK